MSSMKAVRIHTYGGPEVLIYEDVPVPEVKAGEILIRVHAAAVNPLDWKGRAGYARGWLTHRLPLFLGWDVSAQPQAAQLIQIAELIDAGITRPVVETVLPLSEVRRAHELGETGHTRGKIVLKGIG